MARQAERGLRRGADSVDDVTRSPQPQEPPARKRQDQKAERPAADSRGPFRFAGHQTFPFRYGWLKKAADAILEDPTLFSRERAIVTLGVGKNMVESIRHWALASRLIEPIADHGMVLTSFGERLLSWDPYLEDPASLWLIHWNLVTNPRQAGTWHLAFHKFACREFTKREMLEFLQVFATRHELRVNPSTLARDVECFIRTYVPSRITDTSSFEESFNCPLSELNLIVPLRNMEAYQFDIGPKPTLPVVVFAAALSDYLARFGERRSVGIQECLYGEGSPGQAFKLDENIFLENLEALRQLTSGSVDFDDKGGSRQIYWKSNLDAMRLLSAYYRNEQ